MKAQPKMRRVFILASRIGLSFFASMGLLFAILVVREIIIGSNEKITTPITNESALKLSASSAPKILGAFNTPSSRSEPILKDWQDLASKTLVGLWCGNLRNGYFEDGTWGSGTIINASGVILTNNHIVYTTERTIAGPREIVRKDCLVVKQSGFGDIMRPKAYYWSTLKNYHNESQIKKIEGWDNCYANDFALLEIQRRVTAKDIPLFSSLALDPTLPDNFMSIEISTGTYYWFPFDWSYQPKMNDNIASLGYAGENWYHQQISNIGGEINGIYYLINKGAIEALTANLGLTKGMSGGITLFDKTHKAVGLNFCSTEKEAYFLFRDFLNNQMSKDFGFTLKSIVK